MKSTTTTLRMRSLVRKSLTLLAGGLLVAGSLTACFLETSSSHRSASSDLPGAVPVSAQVLDSAASFLGAATGKESPLIIDNVVFVNSALGINDVPDDPMNLYGDLWVLVRDDYGAPVLDANGCVQPVASEPIEWPDGIVRDTVPMVLEEFMDGQFKCTVVAGFEEFTIELEIGRLNMVRTLARNPDVFGRALEEVISNINAALEVRSDPAGRLVLVTEQDGELVEASVDAPRDNLAMYMALMKEGRIAGYGPARRVDGVQMPPQWLEISPTLDLGELAYLRDGTPGREGGVGLINGYADLSGTVHNRQEDYQTQRVSYVQYVADSDCHYQDMEGDVWTRVFAEEPYYGENIAGFTTHADDARRTIVFMHDVIQDEPETELATLPTPAGGRIGPMEAAASFLGAASNKGVPLTVDGLVFVNTVLGLNDVDFTYAGEIYGDLWALVRNADGEPILVDVNDDGVPDCPQPIASEPVEWPDGIVRDTLPMVLEEYMDGELKCTVVLGYEDYVVELELGRLNGVRVSLTNPGMLDRALYDVVNTINASQGVKLDLAGRLAYGVLGEDGSTVVYKIIDSPRAGVSLYWALMRWGKVEGTVEVMEDGVWVTKDIAITLDDSVLDAEGLGYLKHGSDECVADPANCGIKRLPSGYVDYRTFTHRSQDDFAGVEVAFVERTPDDLMCGYADRTADLWERVLAGDAYDGANIEAFVKQAEDTRNIIRFVHTVIQDPVP